MSHIFIAFVKGIYFLSYVLNFFFYAGRFQTYTKVENSTMNPIVPEHFIDYKLRANPLYLGLPDKVVLFGGSLLFFINLPIYANRTSSKSIPL